MEPGGLLFWLVMIAGALAIGFLALFGMRCPKCKALGTFHWTSETRKRKAGLFKVFEAKRACTKCGYAEWQKPDSGA